MNKLAERTIKREDLFQYTFYNDEGKELAVLDKEKLRIIIGVDDVILEEDYGKSRH